MNMTGQVPCTEQLLEDQQDGGHLCWTQAPRLFQCTRSLETATSDTHARMHTYIHTYRVLLMLLYSNTSCHRCLKSMVQIITYIHLYIHTYMHTSMWPTSLTYTTYTCIHIYTHIYTTYKLCLLLLTIHWRFPHGRAASGCAGGRRLCSSGARGGLEPTQRAASRHPVLCFSAPALQHLRALTSIPLVLLLLEAGNLTYIDLHEVAAYAPAVGPDKTALGSMPIITGKQIVHDIHQAGIYYTHIH